MSRSRSSRSRRSRRGRGKGDAVVREVTGFIEENPVTTAVAALAAGALATSVFKMTIGKPAGEKVTQADDEKKPTVRKKRGAASRAPRAGRKS